MEWVVTTAKTIDEAKDRALDQLGVAADEAEFEIVEEPRTGMFGRVKVEARVRARVKPTQVRPKQDRRDRRRGGKQRARKGSERQNGQQSGGAKADAGRKRRGDDQDRSERQQGSDSSGPASADQTEGGRQRPKRSRAQKETSAMSDEATPESTVTPQEVGDAAASFMSGLTEAIGAEASTDVSVEGTEIDVKVTGSELGLLVGPGGRTLTAVQDLARVAAQRRLGDHETRLRIDVGGYREKRREALAKFAVAVAGQVTESGRAKALEPMSSADRKAVHDAIVGIEGVDSRSEGDEPNRRVVITPA